MQSSFVKNDFGDKPGTTNARRHQNEEVHHKKISRWSFGEFPGRFGVTLSAAPLRNALSAFRPAPARHLARPEGLCLFQLGLWIPHTCAPSEAPWTIS